MTSYLASDMVWSDSRGMAGGQVWVQRTRALGHGAVLVGTCEQIWKYNDRRNSEKPHTLLLMGPVQVPRDGHYDIIIPCHLVGNRDPRPWQMRRQSACSSVSPNSSTHTPEVLTSWRPPIHFPSSFPLAPGALTPLPAQPWPSLRTELSFADALKSQPCSVSPLPAPCLDLHVAGESHRPRTRHRLGTLLPVSHHR